MATSGFEEFHDQSGNVIEGGILFCLPEWVPWFRSHQTDQLHHTTNAMVRITVYLDPGFRPLWTMPENLNTPFWRSYLSSHLDHTDGVDDISSNSIGNATLPTDPADFIDLYDVLNGGDDSQGYSVESGGRQILLGADGSPRRLRAGVS